MGIRFQDYCYEDIAQVAEAFQAQGSVDGLLLHDIEGGVGRELWLTGSVVVADSAGGVHVVGFGGTEPLPARKVSFPECAEVGAMQPLWNIDPGLVQLGFIGVVSLWAIGLGVGMVIAAVRKLRGT